MDPLIRDLEGNEVTEIVLNPGESITVTYYGGLDANVDWELSGSWSGAANGSTVVTINADDFGPGTGTLAVTGITGASASIPITITGS